MFMRIGRNRVSPYNAAKARYLFFWDLCHFRTISISNTDDAHHFSRLCWKMIEDSITTTPSYTLRNEIIPRKDPLFRRSFLSALCSYSTVVRPVFSCAIGGPAIFPSPLSVSRIWHSTELCASVPMDIEERAATCCCHLKNGNVQAVYLPARHTVSR